MDGTLVLVGAKVMASALEMEIARACVTNKGKSLDAHDNIHYHEKESRKVLIYQGLTSYRDFGVLAGSNRGPVSLRRIKGTPVGSKIWMKALERDMSENPKWKECADIANFAMMIADVCDGLPLDFGS